MDEIVVIDLFGEQFRFAPDRQVKDPEQVASHLKKYIKEAEELFRNKTSEKNKIAILLLAAMNLSKDYHELKAQQAEDDEKIEKTVSTLIEKINKGIK